MQKHPSTAAQRCDAVSNRIAMQSIIATDAFHLALRRTKPPCDQSRNIGPNKRWYHNHA